MIIRKRRRLQNLTDYKKRVALVKGDMPRIVVRKSNKQIMLQIVEYHTDGDIVISAANSNELKKFGWSPRSNTPTAYLTGMLLAKKADKLNGRECILDIGLYKPTKSAVLFAAAKGAIDNGIKLRANIEFDEKRIKGIHIKNYYSQSKDKFTGYDKEKFNVDQIEQLFDKAKEQIKRV